jgi:hypothetical protein
MDGDLGKRSDLHNLMDHAVSGAGEDALKGMAAGAADKPEHEGMHRAPGLGHAHGTPGYTGTHRRG